MDAASSASTSSTSTASRARSPLADPIFPGESAHSTHSTPTTSVASSGPSQGSSSRPDPCPQPRSSTRTATHGTRRKRRPLAERCDPPHAVQAPGTNGMPAPGRTAHDISNSARSAAQLLQARWQLQAQQQAQKRARAQAEAQLVGTDSSPSAGRKQRREHRRRPSHESAQTFFSAHTSTSTGRTRLVSDPCRSSRASVEGSGSVRSIHSIHSVHSGASARNSFYSAHSIHDLTAPTDTVHSDVEAISEAGYSSIPSPSVQHLPLPSCNGHRPRTTSTPSVRSDRIESYLWDVFPEEASQARHAPPSPWRIATEEMPNASLAKLSVSASTSKGASRSSFSAPCSGSGLSQTSSQNSRSQRRRSPQSAFSPSELPSAKSERLGLGDLTSLRALDMGHRQLAHASSLARTLTRPLSAPLRPVLQFWLTACLSTMAVFSLSVLMACSYLLTFYDDAAHRSRSFSLAAAKATSRAPTVGGVLRTLAWLPAAPAWCTYRLLSHVRSRSRTQPRLSSRTPPPESEDVGGPDPDRNGSPGPRPPLGPLLASLALTLVVALGTGLFRLFVSYRKRLLNQYFESDLDSHSPECELDSASHSQSHSQSHSHAGSCADCSPHRHSGSRPGSRSSPSKPGASRLSTPRYRSAAAF